MTRCGILIVAMRSGWRAWAASTTAIRSRTRRPGIVAAPG